MAIERNFGRILSIGIDCIYIKDCNKNVLP
jgi:hypothetical protein